MMVVAVQLREAVKRRLSAAAEEICELLEKCIRDYEEETRRQTGQDGRRLAQSGPDQKRSKTWDQSREKTWDHEEDTRTQRLSPDPKGGSQVCSNLETWNTLRSGPCVSEDHDQVSVKKENKEAWTPLKTVEDPSQVPEKKENAWTVNRRPRTRPTQVQESVDDSQILVKTGEEWTPMQTDCADTKPKQIQEFEDPVKTEISPQTWADCQDPLKISMQPQKDPSPVYVRPEEWNAPRKRSTRQVQTSHVSDEDESHLSVNEENTWTTRSSEDPSQADEDSHVSVNEENMWTRRSSEDQSPVWVKDEDEEVWSQVPVNLWTNTQDQSQVSPHMGQDQDQGQDQVSGPSDESGPEAAVPLLDTGGALHHFCAFCNKSFKTESQLQRHLRLHTGGVLQRRRQCQVRQNCFKNRSQDVCARCKRVVCGRCTGAASVLCINWAQEPFGRSRTKTCQICGKVYDNVTHLKRHMSVHTGERPFSCSVCGRCFSRRDHLTRHHISHTGMKPYSCALCPSAFTSNQSLKRHMDSHQQPEARSLIYCSMD